MQIIPKLIPAILASGCLLPGTRPGPKRRRRGCRDGSDHGVRRAASATAISSATRLRQGRTGRCDPFARLHAAATHRVLGVDGFRIAGSKSECPILSSTWPDWPWG
jgi:hypothetical protein